MRVHWKKTCTLAALPVLISACIAGFTAGSANASATNCNTNTAWTKICLTVIGSGAYISYATATMTSYYYPAGTDGHIQMINPNGSTLCNSPTRFFGALGESESCTWTLNAETITGNYCAIAWYYVDAGIGSGYVQDHSVCVDVMP